MKAAQIAIGIAALLFGLAMFMRSRPAGRTVRLPAGSAVQQEVVVLGLTARATEAPATKRFDLKYEDGTGVTLFSFELRGVPDGDDQEGPFSFDMGVLRRCVGSNPAPLLQALARLHGQPSSVTCGTSTRLDELPVDVGILTSNATVHPDDWDIAGRYSTKDQGPWLVMKLFLPGDEAAESDGDQEDLEDDVYGEIFFALNEAEGVAEFSVKDPEYWVSLCALLSQVF